MNNTISILIQTMIYYDVMERHCELSSNALKAELEDLESVMDEDIEGTDEYFQDAYFRNVNDYWIETAETLPLLQWYSQFLISYAYFEKSLNDICKSIKEEQNLSLSLKDIYGQGISRARTYLIKVVGLSSTFRGKEWQKVILFSDVRNSIAHRNGFVDYSPNNTKSAYSKIGKIEKIELKQEVLNQEDAQVTFDENLLLETLELFKVITRMLIEEIKAFRKDGVV